MRPTLQVLYLPPPNFSQTYALRGMMRSHNLKWVAWTDVDKVVNTVTPPLTQRSPLAYKAWTATPTATTSMEDLEHEIARFLRTKLGWTVIVHA